MGARKLRLAASPLVQGACPVGTRVREQAAVLTSHGAAHRPRLRAGPVTIVCVDRELQGACPARAATIAPAVARVVAGAGDSFYAAGLGPQHEPASAAVPVQTFDGRLGLFSHVYRVVAERCRLAARIAHREAGCSCPHATACCVHPGRRFARNAFAESRSTDCASPRNVSTRSTTASSSPSLSARSR